MIAAEIILAMIRMKPFLETSASVVFFGCVLVNCLFVYDYIIFFAAVHSYDVNYVFVVLVLILALGEPIERS